MKKFFRVFLISLLALILVLVLYVLFLRPDKATLFKYAPRDAFLMVYTEDFKKSWEDFRNSDTWEILSRQEFLDSSITRINKLDSTIHQNKFINKLVQNHSVLLSIHPLKKEGMVPLIFLDMMELSKLRFSIDLFEKRFLEGTNYELTKTILNGESFYELNKEEDRYFILFRDNVLALTTSRELAKNVLNKEDNQWTKEESFTSLDERYRRNGTLQLYINFSEMDKVLSLQNINPESYQLWTNPLEYGVYDIHFKKDIIHFKGGISAKSETNGYLNAFSDIDIGKSDAYKVISKDIATYVSFTFDEFNTFNNNFKQELAAIDSKSYSNYIKYTNQIEERFDIQIQDYLFNWIDDEIVVGKLKPQIGASDASDLFFALRSSNPETAEKMLDLITQRVAEESPLKFRNQVYRGQKIQFLDLKGFFKLFAGNLFQKLERPYFTIIGDYVVFSNSVNSLIRLLDHFANKNTLDYDDTFKDVYRNFDENGNVQIFVNSRELYQSIYYHTDVHTQNLLRKNRNVLMSLEAFGIQIKPYEDSYESEIRIQLNTDTDAGAELVAFESQASKSENKVVENLEFKVDPTLMGIGEDSTGEVKVFYPDSTLWYEGTVKKGNPDKLWRSFYESGRMKSSVLYEEGNIQNYAVFYYDNPGNTIHIKAQFENSSLTGQYKEFFPGGGLKAQIPYEEGKPEGKALYYYPNGQMKIVGYFNEGKRRGKWKFYDKRGHLIREIKY